MHAALDFAVGFPDLLREWHATSHTLVVLAAPDELSLGRLRDDLIRHGLRTVPFHEPDLDGALTAVACEPAARRLVAHLPLALPRRREVKT